MPLQRFRREAPARRFKTRAGAARLPHPEAFGADADPDCKPSNLKTTGQRWKPRGREGGLAPALSLFSNRLKAIKKGGFIGLFRALSTRIDLQRKFSL